MHTDVSCYLGARALVFGAGGFIGRWVARALQEQGADVFLVVRDVTLAERILSQYGVTGEIIHADLLESERISDLIRSIQPQITFNLAGYGVDRSERDETMSYRINAHFVKSLCKSIAMNQSLTWRGQCLVHAGSALEYGSAGGNLREDAPVKPDTVYGKSKLGGSSLLQQFCIRHGFRGVTARLFSVYGPGEHAGRLLPAIVECARIGLTLPLTAGLQRRDFTYVEDVAEGLLRLGLSATCPGDIVNLASGKLTSVRKFARSAALALGIPNQRLAFGAIPARYEEMQHEKVSIDRLRQVLNWVPETSVPEGIRRTLSFDFPQSVVPALRTATVK